MKKLCADILAFGALAFLVMSYLGQVEKPQQINATPFEERFSAVYDQASHDEMREGLTRLGQERLIKAQDDEEDSEDQPLCNCELDDDD